LTGPETNKINVINENHNLLIDKSPTLSKIELNISKNKKENIEMAEQNEIINNSLLNLPTLDNAQENMDNENEVCASNLNIKSVVKISQNLNLPTDQGNNPSKVNGEKNEKLEKDENNEQVYHQVINVTTGMPLDCKENEVLCKICYEGETQEKPISRPCMCHGTMQFIHLECLKKWVGEKDVRVDRPICEICKYEYRLKFEYEYIYSEKKTIAMMKNLLLVLIVTIVVLVLIDVLIMVILGSISTFADGDREKILHVLIGISFGVLGIVLLTFFRNFRENYFDKEMINWEVKNYEIGNCYFNI